MPLPVGVQLGVELTNFVLPLTKSAFRLGTLAAREAIERSGSDELTELKLAQIFGQLRLDAAIATHFRAVVARSNWTAVSQFMKDVVLESGAGPTVSQALASDNPALLSMVVQLSFLSWSHDVQSLGQAITQVVDEALLERQGSTVGGLNYVALLGTIKACQEQTAAFSWEPHYRAVESKFRAPESTGAAGKQPEKQRRLSESSGDSLQVCSDSIQEEEDGIYHGPAAAEQGIPFVVLSALLRFLEPIQRLPDEYLLELSCDRGISSVVIWCYYILGLSIAVKIDGNLFRFGDEPCSITINAYQSEPSAVLLQRVSPNEPLFTLQRTDFDPILETDERAAARGFLRTVLEGLGYGADDVRRVGGWLAAKCQSNYHDPLVQDECACYEVERATRGSSGADEGTQGARLRPLTHKLADEIWATVSFLLDIHLDPVEEPPCHEPHNTVAQRLEALVFWPTAMKLVYTFAQVKDRDGCGSMPLSVTAFHELGLNTRAQNTRMSKTTNLNWQTELPDTIESFEHLCQLLLGRRYSPDFSPDALLVSGRGWSIFLPTVDAVDPAEVLGNSLHIKFGVPARDGIRKARIVDGHFLRTDWIGLPSIQSPSFSDISKYWPGLSTAKLVATHVGFHREHDAFTVTQQFYKVGNKWYCESRHHLGLRLKQHMGRNWRILAKCPCDPKPSTADALRTIDRFLEDPSGAHAEFKSIFPNPRWDNSQVQASERIFQRGDKFYFFATNNEAARWLAMKALVETLWGQKYQKYPRFIRGPGCCVACAIDAAVPNDALVVL